MQWRGKLKRFGLRFAICLVILGGVYITIFGLKPASQNTPKTPTAKVLALRAALDQTYIDSSVLAHYRQNDSVSYSTMSALIGQLGSDIKSLKTALGRAPKQVTPDLRKQINNVASSENQAVSSFTARYTVLMLPIAYDPVTDLEKLDISSDGAKILQRASAAQAGLKKAANNTNTSNSSNALDVGTVGSANSLVDTATRQSLLSEASCFGRLADQLKAHQMSQAAQTRSSCTKGYPAARQKAISDVIQGSFSPAYEASLKRAILPLLNQLTSVANQLAKASKAQTPSK